MPSWWVVLLMVVFCCMNFSYTEIKKIIIMAKLTYDWLLQHNGEKLKPHFWLHSPHPPSTWPFSWLRILCYSCHFYFLHKEISSAKVVWLQSGNYDTSLFEWMWLLLGLSPSHPLTFTSKDFFFFGFFVLLLSPLLLQLWLFLPISYNLLCKLFFYTISAFCFVLTF